MRQDVAGDMKEKIYERVRSMDRKRLTYAIIATVLLVAEILIAVFVKDRIVRPYVGDILVVWLIYALVRCWRPEGWPYLSYGILGIGIGVELLQLLRIGDAIGLAEKSILRVVIGSVFDPVDILCYLIGCGLILVGQLVHKYWINE